MPTNSYKNSISKTNSKTIFRVIFLGNGAIIKTNIRIMVRANNTNFLFISYHHTVSIFRYKRPEL